MTFSSVTAELRAKLAKLLRMQQSDNVHEAANAAAFLERLCREHGVNPSEITEDYDASRDVATSWIYETGRKRLDYAHRLLLEGVAYYYNGRVIGSRRNGPWELHVFATEGNKLQIDLYFEYLYETMERLATKAKRAGGPGTEARFFRDNFRKGFALAIKERLAEMRQAQERDGIPENGTPAIVLANRSALERRLVGALVKQTFPSLTNGRACYLGTGAAAGREAASGVGLHRQVTTSRPLALAGR